MKLCIWFKMGPSFDAVHSWKKVRIFFCLYFKYQAATENSCDTKCQNNDGSPTVIQWAHCTLHTPNNTWPHWSIRIRIEFKTFFCYRLYARCPQLWKTLKYSLLHCIAHRVSIIIIMKFRTQHSIVLAISDTANEMKTKLFTVCSVIQHSCK